MIQLGVSFLGAIFLIVVEKLGLLCGYLRDHLFGILDILQMLDVVVTVLTGRREVGRNLHENLLGLEFLKLLQDILPSVNLVQEEHIDVIIFVHGDDLLYEVREQGVVLIQDMSEGETGIILKS
jgi:hypothetical protein